VPEVLHRLEVEALELGADVRAVGLELIDPETREPVKGNEAARVWAAVLAAQAAEEPWTLDFFAHLRRVRDFCQQRGIAFSELNDHVLVIASPETDKLTALCERFGDMTFGARAGGALVAGDADVEGGLAERGVDAYQTAFPKYLFCAVCDFEDGFLTVLSRHLWASEIIRRARAALSGLHVEVTRPA